MMFCQKCGKPVTESGSYCSECAREIVSKMYAETRATMTPNDYRIENGKILADMFRLIVGYTSPEEGGFHSLYEFEGVRDRLCSGATMSNDEMQKLYNMVQVTRFYLNYSVGTRGCPNGLINDAQLFDYHYKFFLAQYYKKWMIEPKNKYGGCYIATAVYGSYDAPQVLVLRKFRDKYLEERRWGRLFIKIYYHVSPYLAKYMSNTFLLNRSVRCILNQLVRYVSK